MESLYSVLAYIGFCSLFSFYRKRIFAWKERDALKSGVAVVFVYLPPPGVEGMPISLYNDYIISEVTKLQMSSICVFVESDCRSNDSQMLAYISEVYGRLWDDMISNKQLRTSCHVVGNSQKCGFKPLEELLGMPNLSIVMVPNVSSKDIVEKILTKNKINGVHIQMLPYKSMDSSVYYYDVANDSFPQFKKLAVGGTFDRLHNGHRKLLTLAAGSCCPTGTLVIGIMSDRLLAKKALATMIHSFEQRKSAVTEFLRLIKPLLSVHVVKLEDSFGPTVTDPSIEALVVSSETMSGVEKINAIRNKQKFPPLHALVVRRSNAATLSSSFIREHEEKQ